MVTVISGTNSKDNISYQVASLYLAYLLQKGQKAQLLDLRDLPTDFISPEMYYDRAPSFVQVQDQYLVPTEKYVIIIPEYNGGIPGIFKLMLDASDIKTCFWGKKASITGISSGRSGNLRGLDTLTNIFHYLKMDVLPNKLPISRIETFLDDNGQFSDETTLKLIHQQMDQFIAF